jgi:hypothetical protein
MQLFNNITKLFHYVNFSVCDFISSNINERKYKLKVETKEILSFLNKNIYSLNKKCHTSNLN